MALRVVSLLLSAWILLSAFALPRTDLQVAAYCSMGILCLVAEALTFILPSLRYANGVNAALLLAWALHTPAVDVVTAQNDIISSGLLLIFSSGFPTSMGRTIGPTAGPTIGRTVRRTVHPGESSVGAASRSSWTA